MSAASASSIRPHLALRLDFRSHLNIAGIENYSNLQDILPLCWSDPSLGNVIRHDLKPPILQQAAFDDTVSL